MILHALVSAGHFIAAFVLVAALVAEWSMLRGRVDGPVIERLLRADLMYGLSAIAVLALGLCRVFFFDKPVVYYLHSVPFWIKLVLFAIVGLLSIAPTFAFFRARSALRADANYAMPAEDVEMLRRRVSLELSLLAVLVLLASLMAKGVGVLG